MMPKAIQIDRGREFVNEKLEQWCKEQGIELRLTAPYSPLQNGVAERMNHTLTQLARANLNSHEIPEYLWEYAISHAAYVRNRAYTKPMVTLTPFQGWFNYKPNIAHFANLEYLSGFFHKDKKNNERCYQNQKDTYMLDMMMD